MRVVFLALLLTGCSSFGPTTQNNRFSVERMWVRNTLTKEFVGSRREHRSSPVIAEGLIIQANSIDGVVAYERDTVFERWRLRITDGVEPGMLLVGNKLLFGASDGNFYCVDSQTGNVDWKYPIQAEGLGKPFAHEGMVYFVAGNNILHAVNIGTGKANWVYTRRDASNLSIRGGSQPNVVGDLVLAGFSDGFLLGLKLSTGAVVWETSLNRNKRFRDVDAHPVVVDDRIYVSSYDGALYSMTWKDGRVLWSVEDGGESAVLPDESRLYYSTSSGKTLALDRNSGKILWSRENPAGIAVQPILYRNLLVVGEMNGDLVFLNKATGEKITEFQPGWGVTAVPLIDDKKNELFFMSAGANLFALRLNWKGNRNVWPWETP